MPNSRAIRAQAGGGGYPDGVPVSSFDEQARLVRLLHDRPGGRSWPELAGILLTYGSIAAAEEAMADGQPELFTSGSDDQYGDALTQVAEWDREGLQYVSILDDRYPERLRDIHEAPPFLFARGLLDPDDQAVSVVGSRDASPQGLEIARTVAGMLVDEGLTVLSGLAKGIDSAAHAEALARGGRTVAVVATGLRRVYPAANRDLQEAIAAKGLVISQFWPDAPPQKHQFLMRNATMSGYGLATFVVEAGEMSGARAQARMAVEHGRPVILSDLVVSRTEWGASFVGRPGVHVASSTEAAREAIRQIRSSEESLDRALSLALAGG